MSKDSNHEPHRRYEPYSMLIQWSEEDGAFIVIIPELPGAMTHGATYEEAARQGQDLIESVIDAKMAWGHSLPQPNLFVFPGEAEIAGERAIARAR